jgi:primosomal protein N' (replication factor Y)
VVATPGAEPEAAGGYAAAALLDGWAATGSAGLDGGIDALTRWLGAAALVRPAERGGATILVGGPDPAGAGALVRWDPAGYALRDLAERTHLKLPPTVRMVSVSGAREAVAAFLDGADLPGPSEVLGPMDDGDGVRALIRTDLSHARELLVAVRTARAGYTARRGAPIRVQVDPTL